MKVILNADVKGQGKKGEMIEVSEGYARNYLLPRNLAMKATADNMNALKLKEKARQAQIEKEKEQARPDLCYTLAGMDERLRHLFPPGEFKAYPDRYGGFGGRGSFCK